MRRTALYLVLATGVFLVLARWNGFAAIVFGVAALTWILAPLYWRGGGLGR